MTNHELDSMLEKAVSTVLENMFFTSPYGHAGVEPDETGLAASVQFHGPLEGRIEVSVSLAGARTLAAGFLGEEETSLTDSQAGQMVSELANMLCGWFISNLGEEGLTLDPPVLIEPGIGLISGPSSAQQSFAIENGTLTVSFYLTVSA